MKVGRYPKSPPERKRYLVDYTEWLDAGDIVVARSFQVAPTTANPLIVDESTITADGLMVVYFVSGGDDGIDYNVAITINTQRGEIKEDTVTYAVRSQFP